MKYIFTADKKDRFQIDFANEVTNIVGLRMSPDTLEPELQKGEWLVLVFAIWDSKDRSAIEVACQIAATLKNISVAVRPFEKTSEFDTWALDFLPPEISVSIMELRNEIGTQVSIESSKDDHPVWLLFHEGTIRRVSIGYVP